MYRMRCFMNRCCESLTALINDGEQETTKKGETIPCCSILFTLTVKTRCIVCAGRPYNFIIFRFFLSFHALPLRFPVFHPFRWVITRNVSFKQLSLLMACGDWRELFFHRIIKQVPNDAATQNLYRFNTNCKAVCTPYAIFTPVRKCICSWNSRKHK